MPFCSDTYIRLHTKDNKKKNKYIYIYNLHTYIILYVHTYIYLYTMNIYEKRHLDSKLDIVDTLVLFFMDVVM